MKRLGVLTTGGDCSGLNTVIQRLYRGATLRGWELVGILDGTDGLCATPPRAITFDNTTLPIEAARLAGSFLHNGRTGALNFGKNRRFGTIQQKIA